MSDPSRVFNINTEVYQPIKNQHGTVIGKQVITTTGVSMADLDNLLKDFKQFIVDLQSKYTQVTDATAITQIVELEAKLVKTEDKPRWQNFLDLKRLTNGGKISAVKLGEYFAESNPWGKAAVGFIEGVMEDPK